VFKYPSDRLPVAIIIAFSLVDFSLYFFVENIWFLAAFWAVMIIPKGKICAWNHHHQHTPTFKQKPMNRLLELIYAFHTGVTTNLWLLHHVLGHHHNYMDQTKDESRWMRKSGKKMGVIEYTLNVAVTAYYRGFKVGKGFPKIQRAFVTYAFITLALLATLTYFKPAAALFLFILPMITGVLLTAWATFDHHAGLSTENEFEASRNNLSRLYNIFTGNLGYHTAHHHKQGLHWSLLPALHEKIKGKIPAHLISNGKGVI
jgi:fatty acid desaturase